MTINAIKIESMLAEHGMTKKAFAEKCGISRQSISTIVRRGTCEPRTAGKLASALGVRVEDITEGYRDRKELEKRPLFVLLEFLRNL